MTAGAVACGCVQAEKEAEKAAKEAEKERAKVHLPAAAVAVGQWLLCVGCRALLLGSHLCIGATRSKLS